MPDVEKIKFYVPVDGKTRTITLPTFGGLPIPWITARRGEAPYLDLDGENWRWEHVQGPDGEPRWRLTAPGITRDRYGFLWFPESTAGPEAHPRFKQVHGTRQRRCMDEGRCQVCGKRRGELLWIVGADKLADRLVTTAQPAVCEICLPLALRHCPHLVRTEQVVVRASGVFAVGVQGDVYLPDAEGNVSFTAAILPTHEHAWCTVGKQRIVALRGLERV